MKKTATDIDREAAAWVARRDAAGGAQAVEKEFQEWIAVDIRHRAAYLRVNRAWEMSRVAERMRPLDGAVDRNLLAPGRCLEKKSGLPRRLRLAAMLATIGAGLALLLLQVLRTDEVHVTRVGGFERIHLEDGSTIELNTDSEVRVKLSAERRLIELRRGEAHFKVAHDASRPFDVVGGGRMVRAVGTAFSVRLRSARQAEVLVTEGRVVIEEPDADLRSPPRQSSLLVAGEIAKFEPAGLEVAKVAVGTMERRLAWTGGKIVLISEPLADAAAEFNRYNKTQLVLTDPALEELHIGGTFEVTDLPSFLAALQRVFGVRASPDNGDVLYLSLASNGGR